jgi:aspartyl-tRNA(Asn)/glutamyl-tRNA(Gln) amidotransferase subunit B
MNVQSKPSKLIRGATGDWEVVVGMEVHAQVTSKAKLFSGASTEFGGEPNSHVSLVDAAMPGMLPVINEECVRQAIRTGLVSTSKQGSGSRGSARISDLPGAANTCGANLRARPASEAWRH